MGAKVRWQRMGKAGLTPTAAALPLSSKLSQTKLEEGWNPSRFGSHLGCSLSNSWVIGSMLAGIQSIMFRAQLVKMMSKDLSNVNDDHYGAGREVVAGTEWHNLHSVLGQPLILGGSLVLDTEWHNGQWASPWLRELGYCHWESPWSPWNLVLEEPGSSILSSIVHITWS